MAVGSRAGAGAGGGGRRADGGAASRLRRLRGGDAAAASAARSRVARSMRATRSFAVGDGGAAGRLLCCGDVDGDRAAASSPRRRVMRASRSVFPPVLCLKPEVVGRRGARPLPRLARWRRITPFVVAISLPEPSGITQIAGSSSSSGAPPTRSAGECGDGGASTLGRRGGDGGAAPTARCAGGGADGAAPTLSRGGDGGARPGLPMLCGGEAAAGRGLPRRGRGGDAGAVGDRGAAAARTSAGVLGLPRRPGLPRLLRRRGGDREAAAAASRCWLPRSIRAASSLTDGISHVSRGEAPGLVNSAVSGSSRAASQSNPALSCIFECQPEADASRRLGTRGFAARELARDDASRLFCMYSGFWSLVCLSPKAGHLESSDALGPS